jgi:hypothetical protein
MNQNNTTMTTSPTMALTAFLFHEDFFFAP